MSTTYQLHQLVNNEKNQPYIFAEYSEIVRKNHPVREEDYQKAYSGVARFEDTPEILMSRLSEMDLSAGRARAVSRSDVLVFIQDGRKQCFYYDNPALIPIEGFFFGSASANGGITDGTRDYPFPDKEGLWRTMDTIRVEGTMFFLMEKQDTSDRGSAIVTSKDGDIICDNCQNGLDASVIDQIKSFLHPVQPAIAVEHPKPHGRPKLENYQKYLENGEYLRSSSPENTEEQNYNMIDGVGNNKKTRRRVSVRKRLREKQQLLHGGIEKQRLLEKA